MLCVVGVVLLRGLLCGFFGPGFGDVSGDGAVTSKDLLLAQKHILGVASLSGAYLKAADSGKDGTLTSSDLLRTQKQILGITSPIL